MNINLKIIQKFYARKKHLVFLLAKKYPFLLLAVVLIAGGFAYYFYNEAATLKQDPDKLAREEIEAIISKVAKLIVLPEETPTVATVSDPTKLAGQIFFANAKKGDKVLLYTNAKKAILYDVENNKIVEVAPINLGEEKK